MTCVAAAHLSGDAPLISVDALGLAQVQRLTVALRTGGTGTKPAQVLLVSPTVWRHRTVAGHGLLGHVRSRVPNDLDLRHRCTEQAGP